MCFEQLPSQIKHDMCNLVLHACNIAVFGMITGSRYVNLLLISYLVVFSNTIGQQSAFIPWPVCLFRIANKLFALSTMRNRNVPSCGLIACSTYLMYLVI